MKDIEFGLWMGVVIQPLVYLIMGPSVSTDQFIFRCLCFSTMLIAAVGLRICSLRNTEHALNSKEAAVAERQTSASDDSISGLQE